MQPAGTIFFSGSSPSDLEENRLTSGTTSGMRIVPVIRYVCLVGPLLLSILFLFGEPDRPARDPAPDRWTAVDSLRAMAHLGEQVQGYGGDARFVRMERASSEPAATRLAEIAAQGNPVIMGAQASMCPRRRSRNRRRRDLENQGWPRDRVVFAPRLRTMPSGRRWMSSNRLHGKIINRNRGRCHRWTMTDHFQLTAIIATAIRDCRPEKAGGRAAASRYDGRSALRGQGRSRGHSGGGL